MSTVAEQLRRAREANHLSIQQVAEVTKIRTDHVRALEEGNFDAFSAPVYIRGFVRTLSGLLKLEVPQVMAALDAELAQTTKFAEPPPLSGEPRGLVDVLMLQLSKVDWRLGLQGLAVGVVLVGAVSGFFMWRHYKTVDPLAGLKPALYQPASNASPAGEKLPLSAPVLRR